LSAAILAGRPAASDFHYLFTVIWMLRQRGQSLLASDGNIGCIDATAGVDIFSEVAGCNRLKRLLPNQRYIGCVYSTARINIAE
jgi:hypothetical protein